MRSIKTIGIYKITSPTNKIYIGQSWNIESRLYNYKNSQADRQPKLHNSILKHGWAAHKFQIIIEFPETVEQKTLDYWEQELMNFYRIGGHELMNLREAGSRGKHTKDSCDKIGEAHRGKILGQNTRKKISDARKKYSENNSGYWKGKDIPEITRIKIKNTLSGRILTEEHSKNISKGLKNALSKFTKAELQVKYGCPGETNPRARAVNQLTKEGIFIRRWNYAKKAALELNINYSNLISTCSAGRGSCGGYKWEYANE